MTVITKGGARLQERRRTNPHTDRHARLATGPVLAALGLLLLSAPAFAHATLEVSQVPAGSTYKAVMRIGHGCDGEATHTLTIDLPEGFVGAKPMPKAGWTVEIESGPYERSYELHGRTVSEGVRRVRWTGGALEDAHYDEFVVRGTVADQPAGTVLAFPTVQTCANGTREWTELPAPGQDPRDLDDPAPTLTVTAPAPAHGSHTAAATGEAEQNTAAAAAETAVTAGDLTIATPWTRQAPPGATMGAGYLTITNTGTEPDRLLDGTAQFAERVAMHTMTMRDGMMRMAPMEGGLLVGPGETVTLAPGGDHIMFEEMTASPKAGERVPVRLRFERAGEVEVEMSVAGIGASRPDEMHGGATGAGTDH